MAQNFGVAEYSELVPEKFLPVEFLLLLLGFIPAFKNLVYGNTGSDRIDAWLSVVGRVHECLTRDGQQFEHFT